MKWMTIEEIERAGQRSKKSALKASIKHHKQMLAATEKELREGDRNNASGLYGWLCALCERYTCSNCPIHKIPKKGGCCPAYARARKAYDNFILKIGRLSTFRKHEQKLVEYLESFL